MKIYLAHPYVCRGSGRVLQRHLEWDGYEITNPFDHVLTKEWRKKGDSLTAHKIVEKDIQLINETDVVLAYLPCESIGVSMEIFYASYCLGKPVIVFTHFYHPWLLSFSAYVVKNLDELKEALQRCEQTLN